MKIHQTAAGQNERYDAFAIRKYEIDGEKLSDWLRVGVAFPHKNGKGFNVLLEAMPISGELVVLLHEPQAPSTQGPQP